MKHYSNRLKKWYTSRKNIFRDSGNDGGRSMAARCDECAYFVYDEEYEEYLCEIDLDEDEVARFYSDSHYNCPYYRNGDEYRVVRHQM